MDEERGQEMSIVQHEVEHSKIGLSKKIQKKIDEAIAKIPKQGGGGGGVEDVNVDGKTYGRRNGKWVEIGSGGVATETDPIFSASEAANFVAGDKANLDNQSGVNTGDQDLSGYLTLDQTTPQTITGGIPLLTGLTPTTDYQIATKKYVDDNAGGTTSPADTTDISITRESGNITRLDWESGKSAVLNRVNGVLDSVVLSSDGADTTKTLLRDESGVLIGITTS